jgi:hypothetical protein
MVMSMYKTGDFDKLPTDEALGVFKWWSWKTILAVLGILLLAYLCVSKIYSPTSSAVSVATKKFSSRKIGGRVYAVKYPPRALK